MSVDVDLRASAVVSVAIDIDVDVDASSVTTVDMNVDVNLRVDAVVGVGTDVHVNLPASAAAAVGYASTRGILEMLLLTWSTCPPSPLHAPIDVFVPMGYL